MQQKKQNWIETISLILKSLRCRSAVAPLSIQCRSAAVAPLLSLLLSLCSHLCFRLRCRSAVAPLSLLFRSAVTVTFAPLSLSCSSATTSVAPLTLLSLRCQCWYHSCCHSTLTPGVTLVLMWCCSGVTNQLVLVTHSVRSLTNQSYLCVVCRWLML